ncbi:hypothetical protein M514_03696 [Trichuris suis]|uniref:Uncharacterized protein n=1 Tax=Trichuris suis TaxID=68888 RepID=A0A085MDR0_9BILA|nr:hypothetical protein M513_03696 [Trichuris suis]KFD68680.1 hypothetical protein M514_03696 [Trichuris suis]
MLRDSKKPLKRAICPKWMVAVQKSSSTSVFSFLGKLLRSYPACFSVSNDLISKFIVSVRALQLGVCSSVPPVQRKRVTVSRIDSMYRLDDMLL